MSNILGLKIFSDTLKKPYQNSILESLGLKAFNGKTIDFFETNNFIFKVSCFEAEEKCSFQDESERYSLILDGTIYNAPELRNELLKLGVFFQSRSIAEVICRYLIQFGTEGIDKFNGNFAIAFWDKEDDELLLIRDHLGVKPLLYTLQDDFLFFASDLSYFRPLATNWEIDKIALNYYFRFSYIPAPFTIIERVNKLLPGHYLRVKKGESELHKYYSPQISSIKYQDYQSAQEQVNRIIEEGVLQRIDTEEPIGSFLSGGVDSSIVSMLTNKNLGQVRTFSVGFKDSGFFDESQYAQRVADHINSSHILVQLGKEEAISGLKEIISIVDEPYADSSVVALYFLAKRAKEQAKVCLSGDGADEIFAGYNKHKAYLRSKKPGLALKIASQLSKFVAGGSRKGKISNKLRQIKKFQNLLTKKWAESYWMLAEFTSLEKRKSLLLDCIELSPQLEVGDDNLANFLRLDQTFVLPNDMLKKVDIMSRHHSIEITSPFINRELVDLANSFPDNYRLEGGQGKRILKDCFEKTLPEEVFSRSKRGFEIPLHDWMRETFSEISDVDWFNDVFLQHQNLFSYEGINKLRDDFEKNKEEEATISMWMYIVFQNWYSRWTEK